MRFLSLTRPTLARNLALDEALLESAEVAAEGEADRQAGSRRAETPAAASDGELLRLWEADAYAVVVGRSSSVRTEVNEAVCAARGIPVARRCSGGTSVVIGPGCLMYAVLLDQRHQPHLRQLDVVHEYVMGRMQQACQQLGWEVAFQGTCDLTWQGKKFSGNSLRVKRHHTLYHGTLLYDFDLSLISQLLRTPPRQPDYRDGRTHDEFVTNLPPFAAPHVGTDRRDALIAALREVWQADEELRDVPVALEQELAQQRYQSHEWLYKRP